MLNNINRLHRVGLKGPAFAVADECYFLPETELHGVPILAIITIYQYDREKGCSTSTRLGY